jgi:hypothetical protein
MSMSFLWRLKLVCAQPVSREVSRRPSEAVSTRQPVHIVAAIAQAACWEVPLSVLFDGVDQ